MKSRVVPGSGLTIARSVPTIRLSSELFPALGSPRMTVLIPSRSRVPVRSVARRSSRSLEDRGDAPLEAVAVLGGEVLVREVDVGLDRGQGAQDAVDKPRHVPAERSAKHLSRGGERPLAARAYQVHDRLGLAQVHSAVEKRPLREFPGARRPASARE